MSSSRQPERLEVESEPEREARLAKLFAAQSHSRPQGTSSVRNALPNGQSTGPLTPPAELLARLQAFLPLMQAANDELEQRAALDPLSVNVEHLSGPGPYVQMNLGLGVFEQQSSDRDSSSSSSASTSDHDSSSDSDDDSSAEASSEDGQHGSKMRTEDFLREVIDSVAAVDRPKRPLPNRVPPKIEVLNEGKAASS